MEPRITCIVTIHGIGFQQPPLEGVPGYADDLHTHLCNELNKDGKVLLSDDPNRQEYQGGESVPIYVQSVWPPNSDRREDGIKRLGSWVDNPRATVSYDKTQKLIAGDARIAHVALVYSGLEGQGPQAAAAFAAGAAALLFVDRYIKLGDLLDEMFRDTQPLLHSLEENLLDHLPFPWRTSLRIRQDEGYPHPNGTTRESSAQPGPSESLGTELENDVAAYVFHNERRQRVRSFIQDALMRLACRDDVSGIILNTHSNGTVIGLDVVAELPPFATEKIRAVITAGSPIRKYVDFFAWGQHLAVMPKIERWWNFWDEKDFVADPLRPYAGWKRGGNPTLEIEQLSAEQLVGIYQSLDPMTGQITPTLIKDILIDNIVNSPPGGLRAHNYWDNMVDFIPKVVGLLNEVIAAEDAVAANRAIPVGS